MLNFSFGCVMPRFRAKKTKNCVQAAMAAAFNPAMLPRPARAPPPSALKKVTALVIEASMRAFSQSNFCSTRSTLLAQ